MMAAVYAAVAAFHAFAFALGLAHSYDVDEETRAAPVTWWWVVFAAGLIFALAALTVWGVFAGAAIENVLYGARPAWESTPVEFNAVASVAATLAAGATYKLGWLCGLALQLRVPPIAAVKLPVELPVPALRLKRPRPGGRGKSVFEMLGLGVE